MLLASPAGAFIYLRGGLRAGMTEEAPAAAWHALAGAEVEERLGSGPGGLESDEASVRRETYGPNRLPTRPPPSPLTLFVRQFKSPLIYVLIAAAVVSAG